MKRIISKIFCNPEERSIKRDCHLHFLRESITDTCLISSFDRFIVLIWKTDVDSRISVGSPCNCIQNCHSERQIGRFYGRKFPRVSRAEKRAVFFDHKSDDLPPQMTICITVIPILLHFFSLQSTMLHLPQVLPAT